MHLESITVRQLSPTDDPAIAGIIRSSLEEFGANHPGTVYYDESTDHLSAVFKQQGSFYFVAESGEKLLGGAGIYPTEGLPAGVCELVKMYLLPTGRGIGLGRKLMLQCLASAKSYGYHQVYLETMPELMKALPIYEKFGFTYLERPMGNSGHYGCSIQMIKAL